MHFCCTHKGTNRVQVSYNVMQWNILCNTRQVSNVCTEHFKNNLTAHPFTAIRKQYKNIQMQFTYPGIFAQSLTGAETRLSKNQNREAVYSRRKTVTLDFLKLTGLVQC